MYIATIIDTTDAFPTRVTLYFPKDSDVYHPQAGDVILGKIPADSSRIYVPRGYYTLLESRSTQEVSILQGKLTMIALSCRDKIEKRLHRYPFGHEEMALIESLVLADRRQLERDQREAFSDAGAMHILAVSGLHVGFVAQIALILLTLGGWLFIPRERRWARYAQRMGLLAIVWSYAFLTGMTVSVMRSALMLSFTPLARTTISQHGTQYNRLAAAALIILFINPNAIYEASFLLSFSAVLAIFYFLPYWMQQLHDWRTRTALPASLQKVRLYVSDLILVSLAAQIGVLPWTLYFFGQTANYFILTNLLILPLAPILLALCMAGLACSSLPFLAPVTSLLMQLLNGVAWLMNNAVKWVQSLPGATSFFTFTQMMAVLLILFIIFSSAFIRTKEKRRYLYLLLAVCLAVALLFTYAKTIRMA